VKRTTASVGLLVMLALVAAGCATGPSATDRLPPGELTLHAPAERSPAPATPSIPQGSPRYRVTAPPASFREVPPQLAGGIDDGNVHMAFTRGDDPHTSPDWAVLRVTVVRDGRIFDADEWLAAYRRVSMEDESPAARRAAAKIMVPGHGEGIIERDPEPVCRGTERASLPPGRCGITVLRFSDAPGIQIVLSASGTAGEGELLALAASVERSSE